jgi:hypothetical protein
VKPYIDKGRRDYPHYGIPVPTICNPGRTAYLCSVQLLTRYNTDWTGYSRERTAITGLSNSCVPVIDADTLDIGLVECIGESIVIENSSQ